MYSPIKVHLESGKKYAWCSCGLSTNQPFCDGSHKRTPGGEGPMIFEVQESGTKGLCTCKHTKNPPFCDGAHKAIN
ncbi:MAG: CDGSH iron-sulfur domain-containing protein [Alphaproteobacteria bacterium]|nr:CDGSH iron-sulfur domain-containing protein [Alphaproteobacteria bacterium]